MALNDFTTTVRDGGLGIGQTNGDAVIIAVGAAGGGTVATVSDLLKKADDIKTEFTSGPLVEAGCYHVVTSKQPLYGVRVTASVVGTSSAITKSNGASPTITKSGVPKDTYSVIFEIMSDGVVASGSSTGSYRYSVDGGDTYSAEIAIPTATSDAAASRSGTVVLSALDYADAATVTGTGDLSAGALYGGGGTLDGLTVTAEIDNGGSATCTFVAPANKAAVLSQLNAAIGSGTAFTAPGNFLVITSTNIGATGEIDITAGTALVALGLSVATTTGDPGDLDGQGFAGTITSGGAFTVTFGAPANAAAVLSEINSDVGASVATQNGSGQLVLTSTDVGGAAEVTITAGGTALATLGLTAGTTLGTDGEVTITLGDTGETLTLIQGNYTDGDTYTWTTTEPSYVLGDLTTAMDAIVAATTLDYFLIHVIGAASSAANARAIADSLETYAEDLAALHKFVQIVMACPKASVSTATQLRTAFETFASSTSNTRVKVVYPYVELESEATKENGQKRVFERSLAWALVAREAAIEISESPAWVGRGKLAGVKLVSSTYLNEADTMDDWGFVTVREVIGKTGYFINQDRIMAPVGSDFVYGEYRRIMDVACKTARARGVNYLNGKLLADPTMGFITETSARGVEDDIGGALSARLVPDHASSATVVVARDEDILSTQSFSLTTRIVPPAYGRAIEHDIAFINPAATG